MLIQRLNCPQRVRSKLIDWEKVKLEVSRGVQINILAREHADGINVINRETGEITKTWLMYILIIDIKSNMYYFFAHRRLLVSVLEVLSNSKLRYQSNANTSCWQPSVK